MTTGTQEKTIVEAKWPAAKVQEQTAKMTAGSFGAAISALSKFGEEAVSQFQQAKLKQQIEYFKALNIHTPIELVKAKAELETNLFGSKIEISGDEKSAQLKYLSCAVWNAAKSCGKVGPEEEKKMGACFQTATENLAKEFGFKGNVRFEGETGAIITFTK